MKKTRFQERLTALRGKLANISPDTLWIIQPENRRYLLGFRAEDGQLTESSGSLLINRAEALLLTDSRYTTEAEKEATDYEVITLKDGIVKGLPDLLARHGVVDIPTGISRFGDRHRAYVKVQDGCLLRCSYCIIPHVRPQLTSRPMQPSRSISPTRSSGWTWSMW